MKNPFYKAGAWASAWMEKRQRGKKENSVTRELAVLSAGRRAGAREFYAKKFAACMAVLFAGGVLALLCVLFQRPEGRKVQDQMLVRPEYGQGDRTETLTVEADGEALGPLEITVQDRKYTEEEKEKLLDEALKELEEILPGENPSLDEVRTRLVFSDTLAGGAVQASWSVFPMGILDEEGYPEEITKEEGEVAKIQAALTCEDRELLYTVHARVLPPLLSEEENLVRSIQEEASRADEAASHEEALSLPQEAEGKRLVWYRQQEHPAVLVLFFTILAAVCVSARMDQQIHKKAEARRNQLLLDYPDLMWKLAMLLGAGLTMKGAFHRIVEEYRRNFAKNRRLRYVYEEMDLACHEMRSGIAEAEAYDRFGKRCQLPEYIRLGSLLSQNLKKGSKGLTQLLEREASEAMTQRKSQARKMGERAGTRLLFPMMLMLAIVLAILMIPAFLSF